MVLLGAHTSAAGGVQNALYEGKSIGASVVQLFTSNQKQWNGKSLHQDELKAWQKALDETGITHVMSHDSYLINLGAFSPDILEKSRKAFQEELIRCHLLNIPLLNFHPGAATTGTVEQCIETIIASLLQLEELILKGPTKIVLETTAGQGTSVGHRFEHLSAIIQGVKGRFPIGVCIDTCHIFAAGYDIRDGNAWQKTLDEFDRIIGLAYLSAFHLNDSMKDFGSRVDRHAPIGEGKIGLASFEWIMQNNDLPKYLETPGGTAAWKQEINTLLSLAHVQKKN
jgi:deoxyribonuclease IV